MSAQRKSLPFFANFAAGATAGVCEILIFYPLDVVKVRMQLAVGKSAHSLVGSFRTILREEGVRRMYRGLLPLLLLEPPRVAVKFAGNDFWGKTYLRILGESKMTQSLSILTGCSAGATESLVVVPFDFVKIRLQNRTSTFQRPMDVMKHVMKTEGFSGMFAGMEATFWRHIWWNGGFFGTIYQIRAMLPEAESPRQVMMNNFISGSIGGFVGTVFNTPFDVVKSRVQAASRNPGVKPKYNWTYPALATVIREEGPKALFKGFSAKVIRFTPGSGVLLLVVEFTLGLFRQALGSPYT